MSISFACSCGKHLRAGDDQAGRHTFCPACNGLVAIPAVGATVAAATPSDSTDADHPSNKTDEDVGPVFYRFRKRHADPNQVGKSVWVPLDGSLAPPPAEREKKRRKRERSLIVWKRETWFFQCLFYPLRVWPLVLGFGAAQAVAIAGVSLILGMIGEIGLEATGGRMLAAGLFAICVASYTIGFLDCVLASAVAGEYLQIRWPDRDIKLIARAWVTWSLCFLAGPIVFAVAAFLFWFNGPDPTLLDSSILGELVLLSIGSWLLALIAAHESGRLIAGPTQAGDSFRRIGWRAVPVVVAATALAYFAGQWTLQGIEEVHLAPVSGFLALITACIGTMYFATVGLRYLGLCAYRGRMSEETKG